MGEVKVWSHNLGPTSYAFTSFMSIHLLISMTEIFKFLTFKIQGQSHSLRSHNRYNILSTHIPFIPCWSALPFLRCSYLKNWPWKSNVKVMGEVKVQSHNVSLTSYQLASLSFPVNLATHCWVMTFSKFDLEIQGPRSCVRSQFKITMWVSHPIDSHPFRSMSIGPPIPEIQHLQNLTLKIKVQGHGWGHSLKSQCGSNILSTHIPFVPCQSALPFMSYDFFKIWPWKSKVKVMGEVTVQSHNAGLASYWLTPLSFHVNRPSHSWDTAFSKFDLENQGSRSWMRSQFKVTMWV